MATARLIDSQKQELVRRFREGESTQALADHFRCSPTTITRMVKAEVGPEEYAALRDQRQRKTGRDRQIPLAISQTTAEAIAADRSDPPAAAGDEASVAPQHSATEASDLAQPPASMHRASPIEEEPGRGDAEVPTTDVPARDTEPPSEDLASAGLDSDDETPLDREEEGATVLAIDDADDFADEDSEDDLLTTDEDTESDDEEDDSVDSHHFHPVAVLPIAVDDQQEIRPAPWSPEVLPSCAYLLVDKTVELQARPLGDIPELGRLPSEEQERQALVLFTNPRQAKRHCGRTQRVIKLPDPALLGRTAPYLRAQGISRVVIEGALYALPGDQ